MPKDTALSSEPASRRTSTTRMSDDFNVVSTPVTQPSLSTSPRTIPEGTLNHPENIRPSSPESTPRIRLLYSKSKVYVYRSLEPEGRLPGYLALVEQAYGAWYLTWTPEAQVSEHDRESYVNIELHPNLLPDYDQGQRPGGDPETNPDFVDFSQLNMHEVSSSEELGSTGQETRRTFTVSIPTWNDRPPLSPDSTALPMSPSSAQSYAFCIPLSDIASLVVHPPRLTQWYGSVIVNVEDGAAGRRSTATGANSTRLFRSTSPPSTYSFPPLWFHDDESWSTISGVSGRHWGGDELLIWLRKLVSVDRSAEDPNLYHVNAIPNAHPSQRNATSPTTADPEPSPVTTTDLSTVGANISNLTLGAMDPVMATIKDFRWNILEKFSRVTRLYKDTTTQILEHPLGRPLVPLLPTALVTHVRVPQGAQEVCNDYESARLYLAKWAASHILRSEKERSQQQFSAGSSTSSRPDKTIHPTTDVWQEWLAEQSECGEFEVLSSAAIPPLVRSNRPLTTEQWVNLFELDGGNSDYRLGQLTVTSEYVRRTVFSGGVEHSIRPLVWKYLLGVYSWSSDEESRDRVRHKLEKDYYDIKARWLNQPSEQLTAVFKEQKSRIDKDVLRTDRMVPMFAISDTLGRVTESDSGDDDPVSMTGLPGTNANLEMMKDILMSYHYYNRDLGYVQGMSDLLAPIYAVMEDEVEAFWCFVEFMNRMERNFLRDQTGMHLQLQTMRDLVQFMLPTFSQYLVTHDADNMFCCFRWLLVWFKREFAFQDILSLWEVLWSNYLTPHFYYFVALAILDQHAEVIMENLVYFDEILKYINDLSMTIDLEATLRRAEVLFYRFKEQIQFFETYHGRAHSSTSNTGGDAKGKVPRLPDTLQALLVPVPLVFATTSSVADDNENDKSASDII
ncbi:GTPase activating protein [Dispira simplex]|nr:GTPase activating protein [Dispira simplex]